MTSHQMAMVLLTAAVAAASNQADPFPAPKGDNAWQWVNISGTKCMDGSETGAFIRYSSSGSKKLGIYLSPGGACFNMFTCNLACTSHPKDARTGSEGIFSTQDSKNPFKDFNWISVPYCTGDVHMGANEIHFKGSNRHFHGRKNLALVVAKAFATFPALETLVVTGESAGGFGAVSNYDFIRSHWTKANGNGDITAALLDDSGPVLDDIAMCLQKKWRETWNLSASLPQGCACSADDGNLASVWEFIQNKWPKDSVGLISSLHDKVISSFFSFGDLGCHTPIPLGYKNKIKEGLTRLSVKGIPIYMIDGGSHTHTSQDEFFSRKVGDTALYEWVAQLIGSGAAPSTVVPASNEIDTVITV